MPESSPRSDDTGLIMMAERRPLAVGYLHRLCWTSCGSATCGRRKFHRFFGWRPSRNIGYPRFDRSRNVRATPVLLTNQSINQVSAPTQSAGERELCIRSFTDWLRSERGLRVKDRRKAGAEAAGGRSSRSDSASGRECLLDIAIELFANHGIANTTVTQIAAAGNVTSAMVHYWFETREKLYDAIVDERLVPKIRAIWSPVDLQRESAHELVQGCCSECSA